MNKDIFISHHKEMVISYAKHTPDIPCITIDNAPIERVSTVSMRPCTYQP